MTVYHTENNDHEGVRISYMVVIFMPAGDRGVRWLSSGEKNL